MRFMIIIQGYKRVMESRTNLFAPETVEILFGNIEDIYSFHWSAVLCLVV